MSARPPLSLAETAACITADIETAFQRRDRVVVIWSGGRSPKALTPHIAEQAVDWARVTFLMSDERWVPPEDPRSNEGEMRRNLAGTPLAAARIEGLHSAGRTREDAIPELERRVADLLETPACAALLGMGSDGHTASLFPGGSWLTLPEDRMVAPGAGPANDVPERISLTPAALSRCDKFYLLCNSPQKQAIWARAAAGADPAVLPVAVLARAGAPRPILVT